MAAFWYEVVHMDRIIEILFNTNHEMPSGWTLVFLIVFCIAASSLMRYLQDQRNARNQQSQKKSGKKKKK